VCRWGHLPERGIGDADDLGAEEAAEGDAAHAQSPQSTTATVSPGLRESTASGRSVCVTAGLAASSLLPVWSCSGLSQHCAMHKKSCPPEHALLVAECREGPEPGSHRIFRGDVCGDLAWGQGCIGSRKLLPWHEEASTVCHVPPLAVLRQRMRVIWGGARAEMSSTTRPDGILESRARDLSEMIRERSSQHWLWGWTSTNLKHCAQVAERSHPADARRRLRQ
jgi:hypothetical protein